MSSNKSSKINRRYHVGSLFVNFGEPLDDPREQINLLHIERLAEIIKALGSFVKSSDLSVDNEFCSCDYENGRYRIRLLSPSDQMVISETGLDSLNRYIAQLGVTLELPDSILGADVDPKSQQALLRASSKLAKLPGNVEVAVVAADEAPGENPNPPRTTTLTTDFTETRFKELISRLKPPKSQPEKKLFFQIDDEICPMGSQVFRSGETILRIDNNYLLGPDRQPLKGAYFAKPSRVEVDALHLIRRASQEEIESEAEGTNSLSLFADSTSKS